MGGLWRDCQGVFSKRGMPFVLLPIGVVAGIDAHEGLPLDILAALFSAALALACVLVACVLTPKAAAAVRLRRQRARPGPRG